MKETPIDSTVTSLDKFIAPYGREIALQNVEYINGTSVLRIRIREGSRFTVMDINPETAIRWAKGMLAWAGQDD